MEFKELSKSLPLSVEDKKNPGLSYLLNHSYLNQSRYFELVLCFHHRDGNRLQNSEFIRTHSDRLYIQVYINYIKKNELLIILIIALFTLYCLYYVLEISLTDNLYHSLYNCPYIHLKHASTF